MGAIKKPPTYREQQDGDERETLDARMTAIINWFEQVLGNGSSIRVARSIIKSRNPGRGVTCMVEWSDLTWYTYMYPPEVTIKKYPGAEQFQDRQMTVVDFINHWHAGEIQKAPY